MTATAETKLTRVFAKLLPLNIAVQAVSFAAWVAFAHVLGTSTATDAYVLGLSVPTLVYGLLLTAIRVGAIPGLTEKAAKGETEARVANELMAATLVASAVLGLLITIVAVAAAPLVLRSDPRLLSDARLIMVELSPLAVLGASAGVLGAILAVRKTFAPVVAVMVFDPLFRVCFVLAWGPSIGVQALVLANLLGSAVAVAVLWAMVRRAGVPLKLIRPVRSAFVRSVIGLSAPLVIAASVLEVNPIIDRTMAGGLKVGSVTRLELGMRLLPTGLFSALVLAPLTATWAARKAQGGWPAIQESLRKALTLVALVVPPIVVIGIILRDQAVTLAYHGGAFSPQAAAQTSAVFAMFVVGLPAIVLSITFTTLFIVQRETLIPMRIAFANVILNVGLNFAFRPLFGVAGIALSTSVTFGILVVAQAILAQRRWGSFLPPSLLASLIRIGGSLAIATVAALAVRQFLPSGASRLDALGVAAAVAGVELLVYAAALLVTHGRITRTPGSFLQFQSRLETRA